MFLSLSLLLLWAWMFLCVKIDRENDRGLLTLVAISILMSIILSIFFSRNRVITFISTLIRLLISILIIFVLSLTLGFYIQLITNLSWTGFIVPFVSSPILVYLNLRRLFSFPDNYKAFLIMLVLPIFTAIIIKSLPFYDGIIAHDLGIGFPISIYISLVFITISVLCRQK